MVQATPKFPFGRTPPHPAAQEMEELQQALSLCSTQIHQAYQGFNNTCEEELIESYVFEINALHARYNYLLRRLKELEEGK